MTTEDNVIAASGSDVRVGDTGLFCVIGPTATKDFGRTWKKDKGDAEKHAQKLIRNSINASTGQPTVRKLFVVQVVSVVEVPQHPVSVRQLGAEDVEDLSSGE